MKQRLATCSFVLLFLPLSLLVLGLTLPTSGQGLGGNSVYLPLVARPLSNQWIKNYSLSGITYSVTINDLALTVNDNFLLVGDVSSGQPPQALVMQTSSDGTPLWQKVFDTDDLARFFTATSAAGGGFWVGGSFRLDDDPKYHPWLLRLDETGAPLWQKTYTPSTFSPYGTQLHALVATTDGGALISLNDHTIGGVSIVKVTSNGSVSWIRTFGDINNQRSITHIQKTLDGGYILAGRTAFINQLGAWVVKMNADGTVVWQRMYGPTEATFSEVYEPFGLEVSNDGSYFLGIKSGHQGESAIWFHRLNGNGEVIWKQAFEVGINRVEAMAVTPDQGLVVVGGDPFPSDIRPWIFKINSNGTIAWDYFYGDVQDVTWSARTASIEVMSTGDIVLAGSENGPHALLMRRTAQGTVPQCTLLVEDTVPIIPLTLEFFAQTVNFPVETPSVVVTDVNFPTLDLTSQTTDVCPQTPTGLLGEHISETTAGLVGYC